MKNVLTESEIESIKVCGKILREAICKVKEAMKPGITELELDQIAEDYILSRGAVPSFKDYEVSGAGSYPTATCISTNDEIVHGIPTDRILVEGDIVSIDIGAKYEGVCTDMAITVGIGKISETAKKLIAVTKESLEKGIKMACAGNRIGDIGHEVQKYAEKNGFGVVRDLVGHGIGKEAHMEPHIPNFGKAGTGPLIEEHMALAIEPMITEGDYHVKLGREDGWTISTRDHSLAAHFEHTIVVIDGKPVVVTS